jgi:uncharacterized protein YndB with AHSA1/START domain
VAGATRGEVSITIEAPPDRVYALVSDVTRMGEWSPECRRCEWLDSADGPAVGASFRGHNRTGPYKWSTTATVTAATPGRAFAFTVTAGGRETTRWRYDFAPNGSGTTVTESYEAIWAPLYIAISEVFLRRDRQLYGAMRKTLERIKLAAESQPSV